MSHTYTIHSYDRVVTAGRVNAGKESLRGLNDDECQQVTMGETVFKPGPAPTAEVTNEDTGQVWRGLASTMPDMENFAATPAQLDELDAWAQAGYGSV